MNQSTEQKIDCVVRVVTPENIEFEYLLAGPFQRLPAFLIDFALRAVFFVAMVVIGLLIGLPLAGGLGLVAAWVIGFVGFFVLSWAYGAVMEAQFNGRTIGKILLGLRVISTDGRPINGSQAVLRNMLRLCDLMPPLSLALFFPDAPPAKAIPTVFVGLVAMTLTSRMQRIGDLAAGTMVVWDGRRGVSTNLQPDDERAFALAEFIPPTFQISRTLARAVGLYMERRRFLSPQRRHEIANFLAEPLLVQFDLRPDTSADLLLCALYVRIYHSEQQRTAKLESLRGQSYLRPSRHVTASAPLHPLMPPIPPVHPPVPPVHPPVQSSLGVSEQSAIGLDPSQPIEPTLVPAERLDDDLLQVIEAQAVEPIEEPLQTRHVAPDQWPDASQSASPGQSPGQRGEPL